MRRAARAARTGSAACLLAVALAAAGCGGGEPDAPPGVLRASWGEPQHPLEPADTNEVQGGKVLDMLFRGLKRYDPATGAARNQIAEAITTSDQRNFTITLKPGWRFSDGEPVTAHSFADAWNFAALSTNRQVNAAFFSYIDGYDRVHPASGRPTAAAMSGLRVIDDRTFDVRLTQPFSTWPDTLGYAAYYPLPKAFFTDRARWLAKPIGDGPYLVDSYTRGSVLRLRRWSGYRGPDRARNAGVDLRVYTDADTAYTDLQAGNLDLVDDIPLTQLKNIRKDLGNRYLNRPAGVLQTVAFPLYDRTWSAPGMDKVRRGLSMAIDRAAITRSIFQHTRTPASDWTSPVLGAAGGYRPGLCGESCTYDPARARALIKEGGGLPGGRVSIVYNADTGSHQEWIDAVCNSINRVLGNDRACTGAPVGTFADFRNRIAGHTLTEPFRAGWQMDYPLIQDFLQPLYSTGGSSNDSRFSDPAFDRDVDRANAAPTTAAAVAGFQDAERILASQLPAIPLWYQNGNAGYSARLHHVALDEFSVPVYSDITVG